jgi:hypothetical protein
MHNKKKETKQDCICDFPGCKEIGEYKAPKNRELNKYYYFCLKHVSEYNKKWNYYAGMSIDEIEKENKLDSTWRNPTWHFGLRNKEKITQDIFNDPFNLAKNIFGYKKKSAKKTSLSKEKRKALKVLDITENYTFAQLKTRYKKLAKIYHPDTAKDKENAEIRFKEITEAYNVLKEGLV